MNIGFYPKMAWTSIRKNKRLYTPYILTCIGMVMMYYIVSFLKSSTVLGSMMGGETIQAILDLGCGVMGVFSLIFLFYTKSFLIRRRKKEFGLYNILGMGKWNLTHILLWENLIVSVVSLGTGLILGIAFSKFAELAMVNLLKEEVNFSLKVDLGSVWQTALIFLGIFFLILLHTLRQIQIAKPIELLRSENMGEKPPKANWFVAVCGVILLGFSYYLAVSIEDPVSALVWFFAAVIMVIIATYLILIAGSVAVCKLLQKRKRYYYKTNHFVSVSSMVYRMKRNGAGLASICILCTMVLVMISSTACLYIGMEDSLRTRYPRNLNFNTSIYDETMFEPGETDEIQKTVEEIVLENGEIPENVQEYYSASFGGYIEGNQIKLDGQNLYDFQLSTYAGVWQIFVISLEDYNALMGQNETLEDGEALLYTTKSEYKEDTITVGAAAPLKIKKVVPGFIPNSTDSMQVIPSMYIFVPDVLAYLEPVMGLADFEGDRLVNLEWYYGFDMSCEDEKQMEIQVKAAEAVPHLTDRYHVTVEGASMERTGYYGLLGGLFFLGILLGTVFIFAAVLIIYYKQVTEGYEDQARFEIMQKVGMTRREIRKSINSQVLTVFFLPLLLAGVHLIFAFPMIHKMLILFGLTNLNLLIWVTVGCFLLFGVFYILVYRMTSRAYYHIVSGIEKKS